MKNLENQEQITLALKKNGSRKQVREPSRARDTSVQKSRTTKSKNNRNRINKDLHDNNDIVVTNQREDFKDLETLLGTEEVRDPIDEIDPNNG